MLYQESFLVNQRSKGHSRIVNLNRNRVNRLGQSKIRREATSNVELEGFKSSDLPQKHVISIAFLWLEEIS
jgi:hypothetical protein